MMKMTNLIQKKKMINNMISLIVKGIFIVFILLISSQRNLDFDAIRNKKKQKIEPLPVIDHSKVEYEAFNKNFYDEHEEIRDLPDDRVRSLRYFENNSSFC